MKLQIFSDDLTTSYIDVRITISRRAGAWIAAVIAVVLATYALYATDVPQPLRVDMTRQVVR